MTRGEGKEKKSVLARILCRDWTKVEEVEEGGELEVRGVHRGEKSKRGKFIVQSQYGLDRGTQFHLDTSECKGKAESGEIIWKSLEQTYDIIRDAQHTHPSETKVIARVDFLYSVQGFGMSSSDRTMNNSTGGLNSYLIHRFSQLYTLSIHPINPA